MAKKKNRQQQQDLSPENYIRQRSRNLPLYKCWVNRDWASKQTAFVFVAREHVSGSLTFCMYWVDLLCLGIKDTIYKHSASEMELQLAREYISEYGFQFIEIPYPLAHNIIYAAIEYAEEYGFNPHPNFTRVTQYLLEEDTEDIPLMKIHCG
ncbi:MAG: hypothetical protein LBQ01_04470, partial [Prevotellaceae bacterium]|nr:hypothetical protein [Prevotellaceae bacterium]